MRLLVTRPDEQAARTAEKLRALGHRPVLAPVLEIVPTGASLPAGSFDLALATSARAFSGAAPVAPLACVGEKTAAAARAAGFAVLHVAPDAEALAAWLLAEGRPKHALYLAGRDRTPGLERALRAENWRVETVETYEARPTAGWPDALRAALATGEIDGALHYSPRSAALALALIGRAAAARLTHYCLSPAVAAVCRDWAAEKNILVAARPEEEALLSLLRGEKTPPR